MITVITGAPGSGKSAALVDILSQIGKDRTVYVNGIPDLLIDHQELEDPANWHETVPDGSVIVIDEVQRVWRPRGPGQKVPDHIAMLETHRHRGLDFYIITQAPRLIDTNVRALVGRHVHLRDIGFLGRWWYEWPEIAENCAASWKQAPIKKRYRLPKRIFGQYKSASQHIKPVRSFPWMFVVMVLALVVTGGLAWRSWSVIGDRMTAPGAALSAVPGVSKPAASASSPGVPGQVVVAARSLIDDRVDWIPRVSNRPESAPAYDGLRTVAVMPVVAGAICNKTRCKCVTQQGSDAGLSQAECRAWLDNPPFDPYTPRSAAPAGSGTDSRPSHRGGGSGPVPEPFLRETLPPGTSPLGKSYPVAS